MSPFGVRPLAAFVIAFILGLIFSRVFNPPYLPTLIIVLITSLLPAALAWRKITIAYLPALPAAFFLGTLSLLPLLNSTSGEALISKIDGATVRGEGVIAKMPRVRTGGSSFVVELERVCRAEATECLDETAWEEVSGRVRLRVRASEPGQFTKFNRGDTVRFFSRLKKPRNFGNPGGFDYEWWLKRRGVVATGSVEDGLVITTKKAQGSSAFFGGLRQIASRHIESAGVKNPGLLKALLLGERGAVDKETSEEFIRAGCAHLLAISGLHVGFVAWFFYVITLWVAKRSERLMLAINVRKLSAFLALAPVFLYGAIAGFPVSTQRAVIMVAAFVATLLIGRVRDLYNTLALAALIVLVIHPGALWDASFQLSFTAVLAIIYLTPRLGEYFDEEAKEKTRAGMITLRLRQMLFATAAATLGTMPLLAMHFNRVSLAAFASNIATVPITTFLTVPLALVSILALAVSNTLANILIRLADASLTLTSKLVKFFSDLPYSSLWVSTPTYLEAALFYLALVVTGYYLKRSNPKAALGVVFAVTIIFVGAYAFRGYLVSDTGELKVTYLSVGQGDSALVEIPSISNEPVKRMLIDGGGFLGTEFDTGRNIVAPYLWKRKIRQIEYVVLSHPQRDHMGGLAFIIDNFGPREFWWSGRGELGKDLKKALEDSGTDVLVVDSLSTKREINGVKVEFLGPDASVADIAMTERRDVNDQSVVMRLLYGKRSFIFTGDISSEVEKRLSTKDAVRADVLKVSHHGSRYSSSEGFIKDVSPSVAVVSAGYNNPFGFPHESTLERLKARAVETYRTDIHGAVRVSTDGTSLEVGTYLTPR